MKFRARASRLKVRVFNRKKVAVIIIGAVTGLIFATYGVFSYLSWQNTAQYENISEELRTAIDAELGSSASYESPLLDRLRLIERTFATHYGQHPCEVSILFAWQRIIPPLGRVREICDATQKKVLAVQNALNALTTYLEYEQTAAAQLSAALTDAKAAGNDSAAMETVWKTYLTKLNEVDVSEPARPIHQKTVETSGSIVAALVKYGVALTAENKADLDTATDELNKAYAQFAQIEPLTQTARTQLIQSFTDAYQQL